MDDEGADPTEHLPDDLLAAVRALDERELRTLIDFSQHRLREVHPAISERIEEDSQQEIIEVEEEKGQVKVMRYEPLDDEHQEVPVLYLVTEEPTPEGDTRLHWTYLGPAEGKHGRTGK